jgi:hypothetical protein
MRCLLISGAFVTYTNLDLAFNYLQQNLLVRLCPACVLIFLDRHVSRESGLCGKVCRQFHITTFDVTALVS